MPGLNEGDTLNVLIVEGAVWPEGDSKITLSYVLGINQPTRDSYINNATVLLENESGQLLATLRNSANGNYNLSNTPKADKYYLRIKTAVGDEYLSEPIIPLATPAIDAITWRQNADGVKIYVSTKDPTNNIKYYKWDYVETYQYNSVYSSNLEYSTATNSVIDRDMVNNNIYTCWRDIRSSSIFIGSSAKIEDNAIYDNQLISIPANHEKLAVRYSLLVNQIGMTKEAYAFYELMKKNTEEIGNIFGNQPSELGSNLKCVNDPDKKVVGYVLGGSIASKRIFIANSELSDWRFSKFCTKDTVALNEVADFFPAQVKIPIEKLYSDNGSVIGYEAADRICVDCRAAGGTNVKPTYW
ncbi:DUF4249 domain-containing protein [Polluticaenibacter yanchengensis]|uniref:DUF4249 domain-containing protein n=1 Tax=Polluticaenibacter yanchengensis TaxID=3014562 RepID=A0ABT4UHQ1_9BACT|nr:DUF4249 domain-containing protein [Chitinophagaceae bacterium LY-5]